MITAVAFLLATVQPLAPAAEFTEEELKRYFWVCEDSATQHMLDDGDAAVCSQIFEELKARVFKGDARALFDWWQSERATPRAERAPEPR